MSGFKNVLNISKFLLQWQGSEYALGCNYGRVLSNQGFQVCQVDAYASDAKGSEYARIWLNNPLWQASEFA